MISISFSNLHATQLRVANNKYTKRLPRTLRVNLSLILDRHRKTIVFNSMELNQCKLFSLDEPRVLRNLMKIAQVPAYDA